ncbi:MAG: hypothetical protein HZA49_05930, partial [Planctomycetes bacterium]|nr:hypothetical protein [Planctomycetota bacterium]
KRDAEGIHSIERVAKDNAGNESDKKTVKIKIDLTSPKISDNASGWYAAGPINLVFTAKDGGSPPSGFANGSDTMIVDTINIPDPGFGEVSFNEYTRGPVNDLAGNASNQKTAQVGIDRAPPIVSYPIVNGSAVITITVIQKIPDGISKSDPEIQKWLNGFGASDVGVGLVAGQPPPTNNAPSVFQVGTTVVIFTAKDRVGNSSEPLNGWVVVEPVRVNLTLGNEKDEEDPGAYIGVNNDDDNENDTADKDEKTRPLFDNTGKLVNDDDLSRLGMYISYWNEIKEGNLILKAQGSERIKIWSVDKVGKDEKWTQIIGAGSAAQKEWTPGQELPKELWIEGYKGSDFERDVTLELWYDAVTNDNVTLTVCEIIVHPVENDFTAGKEGRILISAKQDKKYHTAIKSTKDNKVAQRTDGQVTITAHILPNNLKDRIIYFRVIDPDPDDKSQYEKDDKGGDNADVTNKKVRLSQNRNEATLCNINNKQVLAAETTLYITKQCSGDNYRIEASFTDNFSQIAGKSMVFTAWKRVYLEYDKMYTKGATLTQPFSPDEDEDDDNISIDNTDDFSIGDMVILFDTYGTSVPRIITDKSSFLITVADLDESFSKYGGVKLANDNTTYEVYFDYLEQTYGSNTDGSDGGTFVEFVQSFDGSGNIPKYTEFPPGNERDNFCSHWFKNQLAFSNVFQIVAANKLYVPGTMGSTDEDINITCIYVGRFDYFPEEKNKKAIADTVVHEIGHQFGLNQKIISHVDGGECLNHQGDDQCVMTDSDTLDEIAEFDYSNKNKTPEDDCISFIREAPDLR